MIRCFFTGSERPSTSFSNSSALYIGRYGKIFSGKIKKKLKDESSKLKAES